MGSPININKIQFSKDIENLVLESDLSYIEAVLQICEKYEILPESSSRLISKPIKQAIEREAENKNLFRKKRVNLFTK